MNFGRSIRTALVAIPALLLGLAVLCVPLLNSSAFRNFLRSEIRKQALAQLGLRVDIGALETHWARLGLELNNLVIYGEKSPALDETPLLRVNNLTISLRVLPLLRGKFRIRDLELQQPVARLRVDARGRSNLVIAHSSATHGATGQIFELEVQHCSIRNGEAHYNDARLPLDAELHNLQFYAVYSILTGKYTGWLSYDHGQFVSERIRPVAHAMRLQFAADRSGLDLSQLSLQIGRTSHLTLDARLTNYEQPRIEGNYRGDVLLDDLSSALRLHTIPRGAVSLEGGFAYDSSAQGPIMREVQLKGRAQSAKLDVRTGQQPLEVSGVSAAYELKDANLRVTDFSLTVLGGQARGSWEMRHADLPSASESLQAALRGASLARASDLLAPANLRRVPLAGTANLYVNASWAGSLDKAIAHVRLDVSPPQQVPNSRSLIPVSGLVQADYDGPRDMVSFEPSHLQTTSTKLRISGSLSPKPSGNSNVTVTLTSADLHEMNSLFTLIESASPHAGGMSIPELGGSAGFQGKITGTTRSPRVEGQLAAENLSVDGSHWKSILMSLQAQPSSIRIQHGILARDPQGRITFDASAGLRDWTLAVNSPVSLNANVTNVSVQDAESIAGLHYPVTGTIAAQISVNGTKENPDASGTLTLTHGSAWNEPIDKLTLNAVSSEGAIQSTATVQVPAGSISAVSSYKPATNEYTVQVHGKELQLAKIATLQRLVSAQGAVGFSATGSGVMQNPSLQANVTIPQLQVRDQNISNVAAQIGIANEQAGVTLHFTAYEGSVAATGAVSLTGSRYATARLDIRALPIAPVLGAFFAARDSQIGGQTEIHLSAEGPIETPAQIRAHLEIPTLDIAYDKAQFALAQPLRADYQNGELILSPTRVQGTGTNLTFGGTIPIRNASAGYSLSADGSIDLNVLQQFAPDVHSSGQVILRVRSTGSSASGVAGEFQVKNAVLSSDSIPVGIEGLNAQINLSGTRADIVNLAGSAGGGTISARGFVTYGRVPNFNLALNANSVRIRYPEGLRSVLSGQLNVQGTPSSSSLTGRVLVDKMSFSQEFDLANFAGSFSQESSGAPPSRFERGMQLNVAVQSAQNLNLTSSKASVGGSANLVVKGTLADPVVLGRVALTSGEVFFLGKRFEVQSGTIAFANPVRTQPVLNVHVTTSVEQYNVTLTLSGPIERLKTSYSSSPALPEADVIHLLAFGNTTEEAAATPSQGLGTSAEGLLAQGVSSQVAGKVENLAGISQLTVDPLAVNSQGNPGAQIAIQQRVTGDLLLTFSTNVTSTQAQTVEVQYQINKRWSVTVLRDQNGGYGIDVRLHKEF